MTSLDNYGINMYLRTFILSAEVVISGTMAALKNVVPALLLFLSGISGTYAQQGILSASGEGFASPGSISYSIGQIAYVFTDEAGGSIIQGVQQPYEIQFLPGVEEIPGITLECTLYPNPFHYTITLKVVERDLAGLRYEVCDVHGTVVLENRVTNQEEVIPLENLSPGIYLFYLLNNNNRFQTYKIIKR